MKPLDKTLKASDDFETWLEKARRYCSIQDRSEREMRIRMKIWKCPSQFHNQIVEQLIIEDFLNELRYAKSFCRGKFRINSWGKMKIMIDLMQMGISHSMIQEAFSEIDPDEYRNTLQEILEKKWKITSGPEIMRKNKTANHAISKGYEPALVLEMLNQITQK